MFVNEDLFDWWHVNDGELKAVLESLSRLGIGEFYVFPAFYGWNIAYIDVD